MTDIQKIPFLKSDGTETNLDAYKGKVLLIVNVASKCGLTPQYEALERIQKKYQDQGLTVLGFPANNFKGQEPGTDAEIQEFCKLNYDVSFPVFKKISVKGEDRHPLYSALMKAQPKAKTEEGSQLAAKLEKIGEKPESDSGILWNFEKFLISKNGQTVDRFAPDVAPDAPMVITQIEAQLL